MMKLQPGDQAPDFRSTTQEGEPLTLADLRGERTILYFYPKDDTPGCTLEAKSLRDGREELARHGFRIVGVSPDSEKSHRNFCAKHDLNFTLLADTDHSVAEAYGVWGEKSMYGRKYMGILRTTFVLDAEGRIEKIFDKVDTKNHYRQILDSYLQLNLK
ncbi:MAG: thioredoxin-dependent thiol peroxidase [Alistipes sp.]|nr:thioredoxin-dependent thiol peroxidase [Alistipes senegalensis]MCM1249537.1 thioredoxin-dependent thiol peroxidase [Alistipes sp.]